MNTPFTIFPNSAGFNFDRFTYKWVVRRVEKIIPDLIENKEFDNIFDRSSRGEGRRIRRDEMKGKRKKEGRKEEKEREKF